ncbi:MAG TPA: heme peroxidase family protein [Armatimonadaceae bacterium]|jgi:hypothetical protein|nr:heme peroxidase family protein [Armatimonadaceae bacterium]
MSHPVYHGQPYPRGIHAPHSRYFDSGRFGRLFGTLPPLQVAPETLLELGKPGGIMDAADPPPPAVNPVNRDNKSIPAGFTFLGQFLDHDITFDPTSSLERQTDPEAIRNFRTPVLELDSVYGSGPAAMPYLYDADSPGRAKLLVEQTPDPDGNPRDDLPRNSQNIALIGDPRNDENLIVSQLQLAFLKFHNKVVDQLLADGMPAGQVFERAQQLVRWHYQWIVVHEFLPLTVGRDLMEELLPDDRCQRGKKATGRHFYFWDNDPYIPVEFAVAAYRFGHSQVRPGYRVNAGFAAPIFSAAPPANPDDPDDLSGGKRAPRRFLDPDLFFEVDGDQTTKPQLSKRIDPKLSTPLFNLPFTGPNLPGNPSSLAQRNLLRHLTFGLPSGQAVARLMCIEPLDVSEMEDGVAELGLDRETPLWFYILQEAMARASGIRLGPVGGRIVAEVFVGLLEGDPRSYLRAAPDFKPTLGPIPEKFGMADLMRFANS